MHVTTKSARALLNMMKANKLIKIYSAYDVSSIIATDLLITVLEKECIKYELTVCEIVEKSTERENDVLHVYVDLYPRKDLSGLFVGLAVRKKFLKTNRNGGNKTRLADEDALEIRKDRVDCDEEVEKNAGKGEGIDPDKDLGGEYSCNTSFLSCEYNGCKCNDDAYSILTLYSMVKMLNLVGNETLWPILIYFSYYDVFFRNGVECDVCNSILLELKYELEKNETNQVLDRNYGAPDNSTNATNALLYKRDINLPYLFSTNLYLTLNNNITFLVQKKIFTKVKSEAKLNEFLAKSGISIQTAKESFVNLCKKYKDLIYQTLPQSFIFIKKYDNDMRITGIESYYLMLSYLFYGRPYFCIQSLHKKKYTDLTTMCKESSEHNGENLNDEEDFDENACRSEQRDEYLNKNRNKSQANTNSYNFKENNVYFLLMRTFKENIKKIKQVKNIKILFLCTNITNLVFIKELYNVFVLFFNLLGISNRFIILLENYDKDKALIYGKKEKKLRISGEIIDNKGMALLVAKKDVRYFIKKCLKM
ncbi:hypothetical protein VCUG_01386 [Vavraia culicis subsp. floridensis]|uniref:Uncharacterized protein n=1 Tax=Vavraia culicis (isolate floridensis) TaxID=948595 RepID=L2GUX5_VAVCU|nr:uncharacterized protein VCUG_01386 [Vavraia culicis subsp. floridensis]ELA47113.1 hypothetical protein VCUG_01386 [Vavraia culicis subsp. floridensis]